MACRCRFHRRLKDSGIGYLPNKTVYLDYNATAPVDPGVLGAFEAACRRSWGNPSSLHAAGVEAWELVEGVRQGIGQLLNLDPDGIHFCTGGTEALHAGIFGYIARHGGFFGNSSNGNSSSGNSFSSASVGAGVPSCRIISTRIEHSSLEHPLFMARHTGIPVEYLSVDSQGKIDLQELKTLVLPEDLVVLSPVNHETGSRQPVGEIFKVVHEAGGILMLDAVQAAARLSPSEWTPYCHMAAVSGHKIYAPKGIGFLYKRPGLRISRFRFGGGQEGGMFPGTENVPGIASLGRAFEMMEKNRSEESAVLATLSRETPWILKKQGVEMVVESPADAVPGVLNLSFPWINDMETFLYRLNKENICVSRFSACTERVGGESRILTEMGRGPGRASTSLRIAFGRWSKREDIFTLARILVGMQRAFNV
ncbi:MAG: aminotransferase class V-fold PLP-dependent enzyme [Spirochaetales bacterium]|nr:aminotransferase class V-fold PLP-dependent enzyme [Spirochaetales bacterium]